MKRFELETVPTVLCCSPRAGGNSDQAGALFTKGFTAGGGSAQTLFIRDHQVLPCLGCGRCRVDPHHRCFQADLDQSGTLFQALLFAPMLFITSPIFFYHLPAQFKALIDRSQAYYVAQEEGRDQSDDRPQRLAYVCLVAGRPRGEKLFDGSLLTLKYFLKIFGLSMEQPILARGKDEPDDVLKDQDLCRALEALGRSSAAGLLQGRK